MAIEYVTNRPLPPDQIMEVFESVGWNKDRQTIQEAFCRSYCAASFDGDKLVGFARAISDKLYYTGIYDVVVRPDYQRKGIGRTLVNMLLDAFAGTYIFLTYTEGNRDFYQKCGFQDNDSAMWIPK